MKRVTLKDIANDVGVTVGTVSHVLNGIDDISADTKARVFESARKLGYISNGLATSLRSGKTNTIAVIVPDISNPHLAYQIKLIEDKMRELGYSVVILNTNEDEDIERKAITTACNRQVDGILLCPCQRSLENLELLKKLGIPFALIGRFFSSSVTDYVCADDEKSGYLAGKFLIDRGFFHPIYIGAYKYIESGANRFTGLKKAFAETGVELGDDRFIETDPIVGSNCLALTNAIKSGTEFDSIVAFSDIIAFDIAPKLQTIGKKSIPIIGFDAINSHLPLPFYNVSIGMVDNGWAAKAADVIMSKINGSTEAFHEIIDVELHIFGYSGI